MVANAVLITPTVGASHAVSETVLILGLLFSSTKSIVSGERASPSCHFTYHQLLIVSMPVFVVYCKAELEGIQEIVADLKSTSWCVDVSSVDGSDKRERVTIDPSDEIELAGSRGTANFVVKFDRSVKQATVNVKVGVCSVNGGGES